MSERDSSAVLAEATARDDAGGVEPDRVATSAAVSSSPIAIAYASCSPVDGGVRARVEKEAGELEWDWWVEGLVFLDDPAGMDRLFGDTRLLITGYDLPDGTHRQVAYEDGALMAWRDASRIVDQLLSWSRELGVDWDISSDGKPVGSIRGGEPDAGIRAFLESLLTASAGDRDVRIQKLLAEHAARWEEPEGGGA